MATFLRDKAHFSPWDIGNTETRDFLLTLKTLCVSHWGSYYLLSSLQQDGLDFVHSFMKWIGRCAEGSTRSASETQIAFLANEPNDKMPEAETHVIAHLSGDLVCSEASKVPHGHIND